MVRDLDPGLWNVKVTHPNVIVPIYTGRCGCSLSPRPRSCPSPSPRSPSGTRPSATSPTPISAGAAGGEGAGDTLAPIAVKAPGEVIRAADWNTLVGAVKDLADNVLQLMGLVSPHGHDHPEIADKIAEVQGNMRNFSEAFGKSLLELRREVEAEALRQRLEGVLTEAQAPQATRDELLGRVGRLSESLQADPSVFTGQLANAGSRVLSTMAELTTANPALQDSPNVQALQRVAQQYVVSGTATNADAELKIYNRTSTAAGSKISTVTRRA